jgi:prevent-host-death family protein
MASVGIRELKGRLSHYLRRVKTGERLVVTERGKAVAVLSPPVEDALDQQLEGMLRDGAARWDGGKPAGASRPPRITGPSLADAVIEGRR